MKSKGPNSEMIKRLLFLMATLGVVCFGVVVIRLFVMQVIDYEFYRTKAINQQTRDKVITPKRGTIYDRNMKELAVSATTAQVTLDPSLISSDDMAVLVSKTLSEILDIDYDKIYKKATKKSSYEIIKRGVEKETVDQIRLAIKEKKLKGIDMPEDNTRYYPYGNFASHIIGFVGSDNQGLAGIEAMYEKSLSGTAGRIIKAQNAQNTDMPFKYEKYIPPQNGDGLVLTVDEVLQHFLEKHLETARQENGAKMGVGGVIMDVKTGEILAMATKPDFDLNEPFEITDTEYIEGVKGLTDAERKTKNVEKLNQIWRNKPVQDSYEPGSTFKLFTTSVALEEQAANLSNTFTCTGAHKVGDRVIKCWKTTGHGTQTFKQALQNSCNPAMMIMGERIGGANFIKYFKAFGLTEKTGIDLPGETGSIFHKSEDFKPVDLAVSSFGQSFQVTPIQMLTMVSAIVNDGKLMWPHIVREIVDENGVVKEVISPEMKRQVISEKTSEVIRETMEEVVSIGTGKKAYVAGFRVGGKTATSEKLPRGQKKYIASFIGVAPMDDPKIAVLVMIDEPSGYLYQGGQIAAPVVRRIMEDALPYIGVAPKYSEGELDNIDIVVPNIIGKTKAEAEDILKGKKILYKSFGDSEKITEQIPPAGAKVPATAEVVMYLGAKAPNKITKVPDLSGKSINEVKTILKDRGLYLKVKGINLDAATAQTTANKQYPLSGKEVDRGSVVTVEFVDNTNTGE